MSWTIGTIPLDGTQGFVLASVELTSGGADTAVLETADGWSGAATLDVGSYYALKQGGTTVLYGKVVSCDPQAQGGGRSGLRYVLANPWWDLERLVYRQPFQYRTALGLEEKWRSKVWLGTDDSGAREGTKPAVQRILDFAITTCSVPMSYSLGEWGVLAPVTEATDQTCAALILQLLRWHPNVQIFWRYTDGTATLHCKKLSELAEVVVASSNASAGAPQPVQCEVVPRTDLVPPCVVVKYERLNEFDDGEGGTSIFIEHHEDKAGAGSEMSPGALIYTIELQGVRSSAVVQPVRTRTVPAEFADDSDPDTPSSAVMQSTARWYQSHVAPLKLLPRALLRVDEHVLAFDTSETVEGADPEDAPEPPPEGEIEDYPRELVEGTIQEWMTGIKATPMIARGKFKFLGDEGDLTADQLRAARLVFGHGLSGTATYHVRYMGTDATTRRYRTLAGWSAAEAWPTGLAAAIYSELSTVRHEGRITLRGGTTPLTLLPGHRATLSGGPDASGPVQRVSLDPATRRSSATFGWPGHRSAQDIHELQRASRANAMSATYDAERKSAAKAASSANSNAVPGALRSPRSDVQPSAGILGPVELAVCEGGELAFRWFHAGAAHSTPEA